MYSKIFKSIYDGSLRKDWQALVVFQQFLVLCDEEGYVDMTPDAISARTTIPREIIDHGIRILSQPDPESRSSDSEGRRIVLINPDRSWGWRVVNYTEYRDIKNTEDLRAYWRGQKKLERRRAAPASAPAPAPPATPTASKPTPKFVKPTQEQVRLQMAKVGMPDRSEEFIAYYESKGWKIGNQRMVSWEAAVTTWKKRWQEEQQKTPSKREDPVWSKPSPL